MSYESQAEPIKVGAMMDFKLPPSMPQEQVDDFYRTLELVFRRARKAGILDRDVEVIYKEVEGLPKGSVKNVLDAYQELVDEGCLVVFGPHISDNAAPTRKAIEQRFHVPAISVTGTEEWLGEWTFSLPQGSLTDEPVYWAHLIKKRRLKTVGAIVENSLVGETYIKNLRKACEELDLKLISEERIAQTAQDVSAAVKRVHAANPDALVHCGFGFGVVLVNPVLKELDWDPPRFMGTAFQNAWINEVMWKAIEGWIGLDQYDEGNKLCREFLDDYQKEYGRRPEYCVLPVNHDVGNVLVHAFANAHPLTPEGVRDALETVKSMPAAGGAPGTRLTFGRYMHRGWVGTGYLVARKLDPDGINSHLVDRNILDLSEG